MKIDPAFAAAVNAGLRRAGAVPSDDQDFTWRLETPAGFLHVHVHENWVRCEFDDPARAHATIHGLSRPGALNPFTGAWNFRPSYDGSAGREAAQYVLRHLVAIRQGLNPYETSVSKEVDFLMEAPSEVLPEVPVEIPVDVPV